MSGTRWGVVWVAAVVLLTGCITTPRMATTRTVEEGAVEIGVALSADAVPEDPVLVALPLTAWVRYGVGPKTDLGVRLGVVGASADVRHRFLRLGRFEVATGASIGASMVSGWSCGSFDCVGGIQTPALTAEVPVLVGLDLGGVRLAVGPQAGLVAATRRFSAVTDVLAFEATTVLLGATAACEVALGDGWLVFDLSTNLPLGYGRETVRDPLLWTRFGVGYVF